MMRRTLFTVTAAALAMSASAATPVQIGIAAAVLGDVRMTNAAAPAEHAVLRRQQVAWGDVIRTLKKSELQILLLDRSNFTIGANTRMTIDKFVYDPNQGRSLYARVLEGAFRFMSGEKNSNSTASIDSPVGTIGIRGTALDGVVGEDAVAIAEKEPAVGKKVQSDKRTATLVLLRGPGASTEGGLTVGFAQVTAAGQTVTLDRPELAAYIPRPGAPPIGPFAISAAGLSQVQDLLSPTTIAPPPGGHSALVKILGAAVVIGAGAVLLSEHGDRGGGGGPQQPQGQTTKVQTPSSSATSSTQNPTGSRTK